MKTLVGIIFFSLSIQTSSVLAHTEHGHHLKPEMEHSSGQLHEVKQLMQKAEQGDKVYFYTQAESLLDGMTRHSRQARLLKAEILQYFHQFDKALETLEKNKMPSTNVSNYLAKSITCLRLLVWLRPIVYSVNWIRGTRY